MSQDKITTIQAAIGGNTLRHVIAYTVNKVQAPFSFPLIGNLCAPDTTPHWDLSSDILETQSEACLDYIIMILNK